MYIVCNISVNRGENSEREYVHIAIKLVSKQLTENVQLTQR